MQGQQQLVECETGVSNGTFSTPTQSMLLVLFQCFVSCETSVGETEVGRTSHVRWGQAAQLHLLCVLAAVACSQSCSAAHRSVVGHQLCGDGQPALGRNRQNYLPRSF